MEQFEAKISHLPPEQRSAIFSLIDKYSMIFAKDQFDVGSVSEHEAHIKLIDNKYVAKKPYCCSYADRAEIERQVAELLHHSVRDCEYFTTFDINSAFWSIPVRNKDRYKTAFVTQQGHYQWRVLPFSLQTSPAIFQRVLSGIIHRQNLSNFCCNYIDDILIFSRSFAKHLQHIELVLQAIIAENFKLKLVK